MIVKRRKRRAEDDLAADAAAAVVVDDDDEQPSLNPRARREPAFAPDPSPVAARAVAAARGRTAAAAARRDARVAAALAAARRFVDDEADDDDDDGDGGGDGDDWNTDDEAFIAGTQTTDVGCDADEAAMHRRVEMERGSGGDYMAAFGPRVRRRVSDTPSPERRPGETPPMSQYGGSFIDDGDAEEEPSPGAGGGFTPGW